MFAQV